MVQAAELLAVVLGLCAQAVWEEAVRARRARGTRRRVTGLLGVTAPRRPRFPGPGGGWPPWLRHGGAPFAAAVLGWVLLGWLGGLCAGVLAFCASRWREKGDRSANSSVEDEAAARHLPLAADLLAACASAGAGPGAAAEAVGKSLGGALGERLARTAAELRLGGEPAEVWRRFGAIPGAEGLARCMERAGSSGAPAAEAVARHAAGLRAARARATAARARRAQVLISAPVGLCFLPAFLAMGVAPVVIGLATGLMDG
ncbi:type II secretion system F family protein [Streptomyces sp. NPDC020807]|uniref:type II secretion system F family protein n=1 Tax=Streptomyces sp. NPDC020807 TaxID=3155119 RepID=UPI0033C0FE65